MKDAKGYTLEIIRRTSLSSTDLAGICADIPIDSHYTSEIVTFNDYYGNAEQIKRFLNIPSHYPLKAAMQHGNQYGEAYWDEEIKETLPVSLAWGEHICSIWKKHTTKEIYKVGAPFFYTQSLLSEGGIKSERARLGKNLLVFPAHSMHNSTVSFDMESWIDNIRSHSKGFDSVRICIYWKDYILGRHKKYLEAGYECVSAGHIFDYNFLPRLRSLIEVSDATMSNRIGSFIGYSIFLEKPHSYIDQSMDISDNDIGRVKEEEAEWRGDPGVQKIFKAFSANDNFQITPDQLDALEPYFGFSEIKSKSEFLEIVNTSELLYQEKEGKKRAWIFGGKIISQEDLPTKIKAAIKVIPKWAWLVLPKSIRGRMIEMYHGICKLIQRLVN